MFKQVLTLPTTVAKPAPKVDPVQKKEQKWGAYRHELLGELLELQSGGWTGVFLDGSAKRVPGWMPAGYGVLYGEGDLRIFAPTFCRTKVKAPARVSSRGGGGGGLQHEAAQMVVVLDSEYVYNGIIEWLPHFIAPVIPLHIQGERWRGGNLF